MTMRCLIVGGGVAGMSSAIVLRRLGVEVVLIDIDPDWRVYGAGITITRPTFRAFRDLGLLDEMLAAGYSGDGIRICRPDGSIMGQVKDPEIPRETLPGSGGIMRPAMHAILAREVIGLGVDVHLGLTVGSLVQQYDKVHVTLSDGTQQSFDLVVGADGIFSHIRKLTMPEAPEPEYTGQSIWRLMAPRPPQVTQRYYFLGGDVKLGLCPVSDDQLYMFLLQGTDRYPIIPDQELHHHLRPLMEGYGGPIAALRERLSPQSQIVLRPLEAFLLPGPWNRGRVLLLGDAAHPTTPQLASGAGMAVEDGLVLGDQLLRADFDVPKAIDNFMARRRERCELVVRNSIEIGKLELAGRPPEEQTQLVEESLAILAEPI